MSSIKNKIDNQRNTSIELLRIIAMLMIVFYHFSLHGGFQWDATTITISRFWYNFIVMGGKIGVDIFVLISGYYLVSDKDNTVLNIKRILKFWGQVFFYSIVIYLIFCISGVINFELKYLIKACLPITFSEWWFASTYFILYLIHPFLNKLLNSLDKELYQKLLIIMIICWSIIPTLTTSVFHSNDFIWLVTLYAISGYIRLYGLNQSFTNKHYLILCIIFSILTYGTSVIFTLLGSKWSIFSLHTSYFYGQEKITILLISLSLFMYFLTLKMNYNKLVNIIATATFGVYLIHDNEIVRSFLWLKLFENYQYQNSIFLIPYSIIVVFVVYSICTIIDLLRKNTIEKPFMKIVNNYSDRVLKPFKALIDIFKKTIFGKN